MVHSKVCIGETLSNTRNFNILIGIWVFLIQYITTNVHQTDNKEQIATLDEMRVSRDTIPRTHASRTYAGFVSVICCCHVYFVIYNQQHESVRRSDPAIYSDSYSNNAHHNVQVYRTDNLGRCHLDSYKFFHHIHHAVRYVSLLSLLYISSVKCIPIFS